MDEPNNNSKNEVNDHNENNYDSYFRNDYYPLISPIAAAFLGLIGGFFLFQVALE